MSTRVLTPQEYAGRHKAEERFAQWQRERVQYAAARQQRHEAGEGVQMTPAQVEVFRALLDIDDARAEQTLRAMSDEEREHLNRAVTDLHTLLTFYSPSEPWPTPSSR